MDCMDIGKAEKGQEEAGKGYMHNMIENDGSTVKQKVWEACEVKSV
jgi:hypothetical protein